jgi:hypothetical protein
LRNCFVWPGEALPATITYDDDDGSRAAGNHVAMTMASRQAYGHDDDIKSAM